MKQHRKAEPIYLPCVLVVEDEISVRNTIVRLLRAGGYQAHEVASLTRAVQLANELSPDLITLDLILPDGRGEDLVRALRREGFCPPTLVVSVAINAEVRRQLSGPSAVEFLAKPFDNVELLDRLRDAEREGLERKVIRRAGLRMDLVQREVEYRGRRCAMRDHAFRMLHSCLLSIGKCVTHSDLIHVTWRERHGYSKNLPSIRAAEIRHTFATIGAPHELHGIRGSYRLTAPGMWKLSS